jgi:ABC-type uncharacterized transport system involved in gliding motility auxiliary subunit
MATTETTSTEKPSADKPSNPSTGGKKRAGAAAESLAFLAVTAGVLILLNVVGFFGVSVRQDLTSKRLYSLSTGSKRLVRGLTDDMEITAYFTSDLPPQFKATEVAVRDLLQEYAAASNGRVRVRFVNPDTDEKREAAERDGVQKVSHQIIENDSVSVREGYRGLVIKYLGDSKAIGVIEDPSGLEYRLTTLIKELVGEKIKVGVVSGKGGPTLAEGLTGLKEALPTYDLVEVPLSADIPTDLRALLIIAPEQEITDEEAHRIDAYVMQGGSLGIFGGTTKIDPSGEDMTATVVNSGLNRLLEPWGMRLESNIIADTQCGRAPMQTQLGIPMLVPFPPVPIVAFDEDMAENPVLFRLDQVVMPFASSVTLNRRLRTDREVTTTALARSTDQAWAMTGDSISLRPRNPREWRPEGAQQRYPLIVSVEGKLPSAFAAAAVSSGAPVAPPTGPARATRKARILVIGTAAVLRDEFLPRPGRDGTRDLTGALALALNAVDWLAQDSDLIAIRAKNVEDPALKVPQNVLAAEDEARSAAQEAQQTGDDTAVRRALEKRKEAAAAWESKKSLISFGLILGLPLLVAAAGLIRWQLRKRKKATLKL